MRPHLYLPYSLALLAVHHLRGGARKAVVHDKNVRTLMIELRTSDRARQSDVSLAQHRHIVSARSHRSNYFLHLLKAHDKKYFVFFACLTQDLQLRNDALELIKVLNLIARYLLVVLGLEH